MKKNPSYILISRTDSIGDVILTLPVAKVLKDNFPAVRIGFIGKTYTRPVIEACIHIDEFIDVEDFMNKKPGVLPDVIIHIFPKAKIAKRAKQLKIPLRIGTTNRIYHWLTCNKLVKLGRRKSSLHEAQLNLKLLQGLGIDREYSLQEISEYFGLERLQTLDKRFLALIEKDKFNLILHPKSQGSGREWPIDNFIRLINSLDPERYKIFVSGTLKERESIQPIFDAVPGKVVDITGVMNLYQYISFINKTNGLVASGTGPLHIAGALGKNALGIYPPRKLINPQRWKALGANTQIFVLNKNCNDCKERNSYCHCMQEIDPAVIKAALNKIAFK